MEKKIIQQEKSIEKPSIKNKATESPKVSFDIDQRSKSTSQLIRQEWATNSPQISQLKAIQDIANNTTVVQKGANNNNGLPSQLKSGVENLSGISMDDVKVHYNSSKPAQLNAHAYAQGSDIHLGPGQENHLPHEAWHVVQQKQGRVKPTMQLKGKVNVNEYSGLEREADVMGGKALNELVLQQKNDLSQQASTNGGLIQKKDFGSSFYIQMNSDLNPNSGADVIQRVGEEKFGVHFDRAANETAIRALSMAVHEMKIKRKQGKEKFERDEIDGTLKEHLRNNNKGSAQGFALDTYPQHLAQFNNSLALLQATAPFTQGHLRIGARHGNSVPVEMRGFQHSIATLVFGGGAYVSKTGPVHPDAGREVFGKQGFDKKEYVRDNRNVITRRYAYVEKSFHQFMEFLSIGHLIGRFQMVKMAQGDHRMLRQITDSMTLDQEDRMKAHAPHVVAGHQLEHVALLHQIGGTGIDQRGLSLTSTPRPNAVISNQGEPFRTPTGVRIKIDLSKIPQHTLLINQYGHQGTKDATTLNPHLIHHTPTERGTYAMANSVLKNRELFLESLQAHAIVEVTFHGYRERRIVHDFTQGPEVFTGAAKQVVNHADFELGYHAFFQARNGPPSPLRSVEYLEGRSYAQHYYHSYQEGNAINAGLPAAFATLRGEILQNQGKQQMNKHIYNQIRNKTFKPVREHDLLRKILKTYFKEQVESHGNPDQGGAGVANIAIINVPSPTQVFEIIERFRKDEDEWYDIKRLGLVHGLEGKQMEENLGPGFHRGHN